MKKFFCLVVCLLLAVAYGNAYAKTYLHEDFYYGMSKEEVKKIIAVYPPSSQEQLTAKEPFFVGEYQGMQVFSFDKKNRLKEISLIFNLSKYPDEMRAGYLNRRHDAVHEMNKFINNFAIKIFFITHRQCAFMGMDYEEYKQGLRNGYMQYYAIGKNLFYTTSKNNKTVSSFFKALPKKSRIIEITYLGDFLMTKFSTFGAVYAKKSNLKDAVERLSRAIQ